ncbi:3-phenylpropionate MFS transporter [Vibrio sp. SCSIO 43137]|uniref:3-phenylpropionate MFS transporter n=1 Tax=Vibrio sp. SCSIO 43137 TaxID=3021011 RepID=UPI002306F74B|nr:3-phenylpropionate MFS transporter [Vibrio sp. SCSIO 43137]WCE29541.1 3-phenylpropionate MFS transporter [Vibrio sp. SCSIO 43137]
MLSPTPYGWISQYFIGFFFAYGVYIPFWALWFEDQGVSAADIGLLMGIAFGARCVANLVLTPRLHKVEHMIPAIRWLSFLSVLFIWFHFFTGGNFWLMALATVLFNACCGPAIPLSDAMANYYSRLKLLDYGRTRLWGSIAFIAGSTVVGYLVSLYGTDMIVHTALAGTAVGLLLAMRTPNPAPVSESASDSERPKVLALLADKEIMRFVILLSLLHGSHAAYYSFSSIYWKSAGYAESTIGYLWSLGVIAEITVFAVSKRVFAGLSLRTLFVIASVGAVVRWSLTAMTTELWVIALVQTLHGITFATAHIAAIQYIQRARENEIVPLQAIYNAIPMGAFTALMMALTGWGYELYGANVFWAMAVMGVMALFVKVEQKKTVPEAQIQS